MKDSQTGMGFLYGHMRDRSNKNVGDTVRQGEQVGIEGTTGHSSGIHCHLEMQDLSNHSWQYQAPKEVYTNPATFMGLPNVEGVTAIYDGTPVPPEPEPQTNKKIKNFPWVLYANNLRNKKFLS